MLSARWRGLSLIELLIAITIIAVLAALAFPVYAGARRKAVETTCMANLRQLAAAWNSYSSDCGGPPLRITGLVYGGYIARPAILACPADPSVFGYGGEAERDLTTNDGLDPDSVRPFCVSYCYDPLWAVPEAKPYIEELWQQFPRSGLFACPFHGDPIERSSPAAYTGLVLRVRADGSITRDQIDHPPHAWLPDLVLYGNGIKNRDDASQG